MLICARDEKLRESAYGKALDDCAPGVHVDFVSRKKRAKKQARSFEMILSFIMQQTRSQTSQKDVFRP